MACSRPRTFVLVEGRRADALEHVLGDRDEVGDVYRRMSRERELVRPASNSL